MAFQSKGGISNAPTRVLLSVRVFTECGSDVEDGLGDTYAIDINCQPISGNTCATSAEISREFRLNSDTFILMTASYDGEFSGLNCDHVQCFDQAEINSTLTGGGSFLGGGIRDMRDVVGSCCFVSGTLSGMSNNDPILIRAGIWDVNLLYNWFMQGTGDPGGDVTITVKLPQLFQNHAGCLSDCHCC